MVELAESCLKISAGCLNSNLEIDIIIVDNDMLPSHGNVMTALTASNLPFE